MRALLQITAFLGLSLALHAGALLTLPEGGSTGQGQGGADTLSLSASPASYTALIDQWEEPPDVTSVAPISAPPMADQTIELRPETAGPSLSQPQAPTLPTLDGSPMASVMSNPVPPRPSIAPVAPFSLPRPPELPGTTGIASRPDEAIPRPDPPRSIAPQVAPDAGPRAETAPAPAPTSALATAVSPRPVTRPTPPSAPAPARVAQGNGDGATQGSAPQPSAQPALSPAERQGLMAGWGAQIHAQIARRQPAVTASGRVTVQLAVAPSGQLVGLGIAASSGNATLDQAALDAVRRAGSFPRAPAALTEASYAFALPLTFR